MAQMVVSAVGAVVGGVIGFYAGGPSGAVYGAEIGWTLGAVAGSFLIHQHGPQPGDLRVQDSAYGRPIPFVYGMYRVAGNIIWAGQPVADTGGGKGGKSGPGQTKVSMSFAVGLCEGPINGIRRIWANGKLIYDVSNPSNFQAISGSNQMVTNFVVYVGDENQNPDPTMESALGVGNVPPYRGLAYVVFTGLDLSPWGNYLPSLSFEVVQGIAPAYYSASQSTWNYHTDDGTVMVATCLHAGGGEAFGNGYFLGYDGLHVVNLTPDGLVNVGTFHPSPSAALTSAHACGYSDEPGFLGQNGVWYMDDGLCNTNMQSAFVSIGMPTLVSWEDTFNKSGDDIFYTSSYGAGVYHVWRIDMLTGALRATSTISGSMVILGVTASYVYVFLAVGSSGTIYRLNRTTLAVVASWALAPTSGTLVLGHAYNDYRLYVLNGLGHVCLFSTQDGSLTDLGGGPFGNTATTMVTINPNFIVFSRGGVDNIALGYFWLGQADSFTTVGAVVADLCTRAGLTSAQYDVSQLTDNLRGYCVTNHSATRNNLAPLMASYFFDACDVEGLIRFVRRGGASLATVSYSDLGSSTTVGDDQNITPITETITQEIDLPRSLALTYSGMNSDYNPNTQRAFRNVTHSNRDVVMNYPIVMADDEGLMRAQTMLWSAWISRKSFSFTTRIAYLPFEPGDVLTLQGASGQTYTIRIVRCQYDGQGSLIWTAVFEEPDIYPSPSYNVQGGAPAGFSTQQIDYSGPTSLVVLDVPPLRDSDTSAGLYFAACGLAPNWPGCLVDVSRDGSTYAQGFYITTGSVIGYTSNALPTFAGGNQPDELSSVTVVLYSGALSSLSYSDFLAGLNAAYIGGELVYFRNATLIAANTYQLNGFMRGRVGTEAAMSTHAFGDVFLLLDQTKLQQMAINNTDVGSTMYFEPHLLNVFMTQQVTPVKEPVNSARMQPLSPALFKALPGSTASTSDITLSWIRRARVNASWLNGTDVPLDESSESYTLNVINSVGAVVRSITVSGNGSGGSYVYSAANISADGFTSGMVIWFSVQQHSDQGVLGVAAGTSITR
ncbi:phage tail protein [Paraburkholderia phymatum]|uniref:Tip attachment protein J domain-containing protein n=1 Tax=Paraburkholderia phymatum (strain DSM 17167 / CIP 108236 / LMG 21445 / STM815) TaxID=391038 RepID=B2JUI8_PARP8|nr:phage tail protein [Paraburkholderia phymatum]ACC76159.1 hypothetical protein Bphy_7158 [Paraburkholderia phymatum STM815]